MKKNTSVIIMGDIVKSRQAAELKKLHQIFNGVVDDVNRGFRRCINSPLTITLGDEFQGIVSSLLMGIKIATKVRMDLLSKGVESRLVVGLAQIQTQVNKSKAWNMMGPGLSEARQVLNDKEDFNCYRFSLPSLNKEVPLLLNGLGRALTNVENHWTPTQMKYVTRAIDSEKTMANLAKDLKISKNTLFKVLRSGEFQLYIQQRNTIEEVLKLLDQEQGLA